MTSLLFKFFYKIKRTTIVFNSWSFKSIVKLKLSNEKLWLLQSLFLSGMSIKNIQFMPINISVSLHFLFKKRIYPPKMHRNTLFLFDLILIQIYIMKEKLWLNYNLNLFLTVQPEFILIKWLYLHRAQFININSRWVW